MLVSRSLRVSLEQITEWLENPVTLAFKATCQVQLDKVIDDGGLNAYVSGEPQRTQENLAELTGRGQTWQEIIDTLDGEEWELEDE